MQNLQNFVSNALQRLEQVLLAIQTSVSPPAYTLHDTFPRGRSSSPITKSGSRRLNSRSVTPIPHTGAVRSLSRVSPCCLSHLIYISLTDATQAGFSDNEDGAPPKKTRRTRRRNRKARPGAVNHDDADIVSDADDHLSDTNTRPPIPQGCEDEGRGRGMNQPGRGRRRNRRRGRGRGHNTLGNDFENRSLPSLNIAPSSTKVIPPLPAISITRVESEHILEVGWLDFMSFAEKFTNVAYFQVKSPNTSTSSPTCTSHVRSRSASPARSRTQYTLDEARRRAIYIPDYSPEAIFASIKGALGFEDRQENLDPPLYVEKARDKVVVSRSINDMDWTSFRFLT